MKTSRYVAEQIEKNQEPNRDSAAGQGEDLEGARQLDQDRPPAFEPLPSAARNSAGDKGESETGQRTNAERDDAAEREAQDYLRDRQFLAEARERAEARMEEMEAPNSPVQARSPTPTDEGMDTGVAQDDDDDDEDADLRDIVRLFNVEEREQARQRQREIMSIVDSLGGSSRTFRRERARSTRAIISELYSPPRISALARELPKFGIAPGLALDLTTCNSEGEPWDFSKSRMRDEAERLLDEQKPVLLVGTPMCTAFSTWQFINNTKRDPNIVAREKAAGRMHLAWVCKMYLKQIQAGRFFLHEHPANATSWSEACVREVLSKVGVSRITADQCQLGQETEEGEPLKKPTGFMSNCDDILNQLHRRCSERGGACSRPKGGTHQLCNGKRARRAAIFQRELCEAVLIGLRDHLKRVGLMKRNEVFCNQNLDLCGIMIDADDEVREHCQMQGRDDYNVLSAIYSNHTGNVSNFGHDGSKLGWAPLADDDSPVGTPDQDAAWHPTMSKSRGIDRSAVKCGVLSMNRHERFVDDLTGNALPEDLCRAARATELEYFKSKEVWTARRISEALKRTGRPPITVRWVEVNKGDDLNPKIRSRLVAREIRMHGQDAIFAPTPPLGSLRMVLSHASTQLPGEPQKVWDGKHEDRQMVFFMDISRAYFNAKVKEDEPVYVDFPPDMNPEPGTCALLKRHMYGTRRAADGWQSEYSSTLVELGFTQGSSSACVFRHSERGIVVSVHGDDFTCSGSRRNLMWMEAEMKKKYELTVGARLGPGEDDDHEGLVLNRVVRWTSRGLEYEADPRQAERLVEDLQLDGANTVTTPGVKPLAHQIEAEESLPEREHTPFRGRGARSNDLGPDRPDIIYSAKEICRGMSSPTDLHNTALKRLGRYLKARPRLVFRFDYQEVSHLEAYADTDWAGCPRTRRSTSGGCLMVGSHLLKCWSSTQAGVAMSSGEAEFYGAVKGASAGLGMRALYADIGYTLPLRLWTDSSAAIGIASRQGLGKVRHIECTSLWLQQRLRQKDLVIRKIAGEANPADLYTKYLESKQKIEQLVGLFGGEFREGRAESAPQLKKAMMVCQEDSGPQALIHDTSVLPHQMSDRDIDEHFPLAEVLPAPMGEMDVRPETELADPGPRGDLRFAPAMFRPDAPEHSHQQAFLVTSEDSTAIGSHCASSSPSTIIMSPALTPTRPTVRTTAPTIITSTMMLSSTHASADTRQYHPKDHKGNDGLKGSNAPGVNHCVSDRQQEGERSDHEATAKGCNQCVNHRDDDNCDGSELRSDRVGIVFCANMFFAARSIVDISVDSICQSSLQSASRDDSLVKSPGGLQSDVDDRLSLSDRFHHASADVRSDAVRGGVFNMMSTDAFLGSRLITTIFWVSKCYSRKVKQERQASRF